VCRRSRQQLQASPRLRRSQGGFIWDASQITGGLSESRTWLPDFRIDGVMHGPVRATLTGRAVSTRGAQSTNSGSCRNHKDTAPSYRAATGSCDVVADGGGGHEATDAVGARKWGGAGAWWVSSQEPEGVRLASAASSRPRRASAPPPSPARAPDASERGEEGRTRRRWLQGRCASGGDGRGL